MSKELEMLREIAHSCNEGVSINAKWMVDLRRILARMEAAERVCESARNLAQANSDGDFGDGIIYGQSARARDTWAEVCEAVAAYRALDGKGEG